MPKIAFDISQLGATSAVSRDDLLTRFLKDETLHDFSLEGTDGVRVSATRCILAARSTVFHKMLLGEFEEASAKVVKVGYSGQVLQAIVEYILTDAATLLRDVPKKEATEITLEDNANIQAMVSLTGAAAYFDLPLLCEMGFNTVAQSLHNTPVLSLAALEAFRKEGPSVPRMEDLIMAHLSSPNIRAITKDAVANVSPSVLEEVLQHKELQVDEFQLFEMLRLWVEAQDTDTSEADAHAVASGLMKHVRLEYIDTKTLSASVSDSRLVSQDQLLNAYKKKAQAAEEGDTSHAKRRRCAPAWESSGNEVASGAFNRRGDLLKYPPISGGLYQWTLEVTSDSYYTWIGLVLSSNVYKTDSFLWQQVGSWFLGSLGLTACHGMSDHKAYPKFGAGAKVTCTLNLLQDDKENGSLSISIDNGDPFTLFTDLHLHLEKEGGGFVPAVSHGEPGRVRLIEIIKLRN